MAGAVKGRKAGRHATSDWMEVEKQRGISVTSSVMQFEYNDHVINLLDTPGHEDFSEDTYRVLTAGLLRHGHRCCQRRGSSNHQTA